MAVNEELLRETLEYIKTHPQQWNQGVWFVWTNDVGETVLDSLNIKVEEQNSCGSAFCFAGHAALRSNFPGPPKDNSRAWRAEVDGQTYEVSEYAKEKLGITWPQASALFYAGNTLADLEWMVDEIIKNPEVSGNYLEENRPDYDPEYCCEDCDGAWDAAEDEFDDED